VINYKPYFENKSEKFGNPNTNPIVIVNFFPDLDGFCGDLIADLSEKYYVTVLSEPPIRASAELTIRQLAACLADFVETSRSGLPLFVGAGFSGVVAAEAARLFPERVKGVVALHAPHPILADKLPQVLEQSQPLWGPMRSILSAETDSAKSASLADLSQMAFLPAAPADRDPGARVGDALSVSFLKANFRLDDGTIVPILEDKARRLERPSLWFFDFDRVPNVFTDHRALASVATNHRLHPYSLDPTMTERDGDAPSDLAARIDAFYEFIDAEHQLGREEQVDSAAESALFEDAAKTFRRKVLTCRDGKFPERALRGNHPKTHAIVDGTFAVRDDVPERLRCGLLAAGGRAFDCKIRLSTSTLSFEAHKDRIDDVFDASVRVFLDPEGSVSQDFIMNSLPVAPSQLSSFPPSNRYDNIRLQTGNIHRSPLSVLDANFYSQSVYRLGPQAIKYALVSGNTATPSGDDDCRLPHNFRFDDLSKELSSRSLSYTFCIQEQTDPLLSPIEDPSIEWPSDLLPVADVTIPVQEMISQEKDLAGEKAYFDIWSCLPDHTPLGRINRARRQAYEVARKTRGAQPPF